MSNSFIRNVIKVEVTLSDSLQSQSFAVSPAVLDISRCEIRLGAQVYQTLSDTQSYLCRAYLSSLSTGVVARGGTTGTIALQVTIIEYTALSGVYIENINSGNGVAIDTGTKNITINGAYPRYKKYFFPQMITTSNISISNVPVKCYMSADDNLQVTTNYPSANLKLYGQVVYVPDQRVFHIEGTASGTSQDIDITAYDLNRDKTLTIATYYATSALTPDKFKVFYLSSSTNLNIQSITSSTVNYCLQIILRQSNVIQRYLADFTTISYDLTPVTPIDVPNSFISIPCMLNNIACTNTTSLNADNFMVRSQIAGDSLVVLYRFGQGIRLLIPVEIVTIGGINTFHIKTATIKLYRRSL